MTAPPDHFETYFAEKIWEMIPEIYRHEDGLADNPGVLRAYVEAIASQAANLRRSHDRAWEDQFIELCSNWVVPYLGDLLGTRMVSALNPRGQRVDVAKTIYYRRRNGTLRVLEELIFDIAGWEGTAIEGFKRLGRMRHLLDPAPTSAGRLTQTPPGGTADLRRADAARLTDGPFDEFCHTPDVRRPAGRQGRYGIPKIAFYLYRIPAFALLDIMPVSHAAPVGAGFIIDPSGRDIHLFARRSRPEQWDDWRAAREWELPAPIDCRLLGDAAYRIDEGIVLALVDEFSLPAAQADDLRTLNGIRFNSESRLRARLIALPNAVALLAELVYQAILREAALPDCGKHALLPGSIVVEVDGAVIPPEQIASGSLADWAAVPFHKRAVIDPELGRVLILGPAPGTVRVSYHAGFPGSTGAGTYVRAPASDTVTNNISGGGAINAASITNDGVTQIADSATYGPVANKVNVRNLTLQAADQERPFLRLASNWVLNTGANEDAFLTLDGLWVGGGQALVLRGDYETVTLRHCTLDPGGLDADGNVILPVPLIVEGQVEQLVIDSCITGPIRTEGSGVIESLVIQDSIVQSPNEADPAITLIQGVVDLTRVTVLGGLDIHRLYTTDSIITALADVTDTQTGCFRFSAAPPASRLPHPYEWYALEDARSLFTARTFGHYAYGQLSSLAPAGIARGAESGSEMGAFSALNNPIKLASLQAKVAEYLPFGLIPAYINET